MVENFGGVVYAGTFLNFLVRNSERVPMASPNGFMHGGAFRKAAGILFVDPMVTAMGEYAPFLGATPLECRLTGPGYDVPIPADLGAVDTDIPYVDVVACRGEGERLHIALANRHLSRPMEVIIRHAGGPLPESAELRLLAHPRITARANPAAPDRFTLKRERIAATDGFYRVVIPPFSVAWLSG